MTSANVSKSLGTFAPPSAFSSSNPRVGTLVLFTSRQIRLNLKTTLRPELITEAWLAGWQPQGSSQALSEQGQGKEAEEKGHKPKHLTGLETAV